MTTGSIRISPLRDVGALPLLVEPCVAGIRIEDALADISRCVEDRLLSDGGLLFRGFRVGSPEEFRRFAGSFGHQPLAYEFGSTPRSPIVEGVYTSTEYPAGETIPLHNEQSYTREWAMKLWFYCATPARAGGETTIADSREIFRRVSPSLRERFVSKGLMYVRNYGGGLDVPWRKVFNSNDPRAVEEFCAARDIACEWKPKGELRTRQICQAVERHPRTGEEVWFNQAHLFHVSALAPEVREALLEIVRPEDIPRNVYYGDGGEIESEALAEIRAILEETTIRFPWRAEDVLMIDNMLTAHGRAPFDGPRKVLVAMAEPHGAAALATAGCARRIEGVSA